MPLTIDNFRVGGICQRQGDSRSIDGGSDGGSVGGSRGLVHSDGVAISCRVSRSIGNSRGIDGYTRDSEVPGSLVGRDAISLKKSRN